MVPRLSQAKPQCLRCLKHGSHCYYEVPNTWVFESKKNVQDAPKKRTRTCRVELVKTHLLRAGRIIDDYHHNLSQSLIARSSLLFEAIEPIVFECQVYTGIIPPHGKHLDGIHSIQYWQTEPVTPPYASIGDAGYELTAATRYLLEPAGQGSYDMIRASVFLSRSRKSFDKFQPHKDRYSQALRCLQIL